MTKEIIVFTCGDSNDIATWSNVPFLFTGTLGKKGYIIHRVDISPQKRLNKLFNTISFYLFRRVLQLQACPEFHRTWLHRFIIYRKIKNATQKYPNAAFNLFLSFAFYNKYSDKPSVLWCDWTDRVVIERLNRKPMFYERASLRHEDDVMKQADVVYTMFPVCKEHMQELYNRNIIHLNRNVINTVYGGGFNINSNICERFKSRKILFIGNHRYKGAALSVIDAYNILKKQHEGLELHIIGMTNKELNTDDKDIHCHGYLRKNIASERDLYYRLVLSCKLYINPAKQWGAYSSCVEAMYYGTPVVVSPYEDFVKEFGTDIDFGKYINNNNELPQIIEHILIAEKETYSHMCTAAHARVKDYTWDNYVDDFLVSLRANNINI